MSKITFYYPLEINQYAMPPLRLVYAIAGVPVDLTGASAHMQMRRRNADGTLLADLSTANGKIAIDGPVGTLYIDLPVDEVSDGVYDLVVTYADGTLQRLVEGPYIVHPGATRNE